ncbi:hypothetical protein [Umboniibacter marinipuniceus]|uniref:Uncharacterized protein n=1 Tax=Umboniibacter marinipuniceus TaxID=569599 RepID=A0A3M0A8Z4_9GAMM|nr:hypothetical protein [Umboniibacter marinipuniceus]RMA81007.1 hypothetical protein DFR27_0797 [Umboniibacter marinipuniceus]
MRIVFQHQTHQVSYSAAALSGAEVIRVDNKLVEHTVVSEAPRSLRFVVDEVEFMICTASCSDRSNAITAVLTANGREVDGFDLSFLPLKRVLFRRLLLVMLLSVLIAVGFASGLVDWWATLLSGALAAMLPLFGVRGRWLIERR